MITPKDDFKLIKWLALIIRERVSPSLNLSKNIQDNWIVSISDSPSTITISATETVWKGNNLDCATWNPISEGWESLLGTSIPAPGIGIIPSPLIVKNDDGFIIHYDILGLTFWMMARVEEIGYKDLDNHSRFPATASHAYQNNYLDRPVVDEWFVILRAVVKKLWPHLDLVETKFRMQVSHDIDNPSRYGFVSLSKLFYLMAFDLVKKRDFAAATKAPMIWWKTRNNPLSQTDPYNTFNWIMSLSEFYNLKSTFYFICGCTNKRYDSDYDIENAHMRNLLRDIYQRGHRIGLHPSYDTYLKPNRIRYEANRFKQICSEEGIPQFLLGCRMHFLRWQTPDTLHALEYAGIYYDTTLGYADIPGFRCGTCFDYQAYDPVQNRPVNLRIYPLIAMECSVMANRYLGLGTGEAAYEKFLKLKQACRLVNGIFSLLWHNSSFMSAHERELYQRVLSG
jgi:hypothetical protein